MASVLRRKGKHRHFAKLSLQINVDEIYDGLIVHLPYEVEHYLWYTPSISKIKYLDKL